MKVVQVILSLLMVIALIIPAILANQTLKEKNEAATPLPMEQFKSFLEARYGGPVELLAWSKPGDSCEIYLKKVAADSTYVYGAPESFVKLQTKDGTQWFYNRLGEFIDTTPYAPKPSK